MPEPLLVVDGLTVTFAARPTSWPGRAGGRGPAPTAGPAVHDVSFTVADGEVVALVGESGAGKTTTALAIMGLLPPTARTGGSVRLDGRSLLGLPDRELSALRGNHLAMVFQDPRSALSPVRRIGSLLVEAVRLHDRTVSRHAAASRAAQLCALVGLPPRAVDAYPHQLSGGQRQRALVALAVVNGPRLLIADEPTSALDVTVQAQVLRVLHRVRETSGAALLLVTHDPGVVAGHADRVVVLRAGELVEQGRTTAVFDSPRETYTATLLRSAEPVRTHPVPDLTAPAGEPPAVELVDVRHTYARPRRPGLRRGAAPVVALDGVSLVVPRGATLAVVGESGSGKTTTALAVAALEPPQSGTVRVLGVDLSHVSSAGQRAALRRKVQLVFQDAAGSLDPRMTVRDSLTEALETLPGAATDVTALLELVGLPAGFAARYPHQLSGGQVQRVALARALAGRPQVLVLDEPVSALDAPVRAALLALVDGLRARFGLTCLLVAHDLTVVRAHADLVAVMFRGRVVEQGPTAVVLEDPRHPCTRALLDAVPVADPRVRPPAAAAPADDDETVVTGCPFRRRCALHAALPEELARVCTLVDPPSRRTEGRDVACHYADAPVHGPV